MANLNKVMLIGRLGKDPEIRYSGEGNAIVNLSLATSESWKNRETGEKQEKTTWHKIVAFGRLAEIMAEYLKMGATVYIEGKITVRKWEDKEQNTRYSTEIVAEAMQMMGNREDSPESQKSAPNTGSAQAGGGDGFEGPPF